jgi:hypothetical protein
MNPDSSTSLLHINTRKAATVIDQDASAFSFLRKRMPAIVPLLRVPAKMLAIPNCFEAFPVRSQEPVFGVHQ